MTATERNAPAHALYLRCTAKDYNGMSAWFARAKEPMKGRPFSNWGRVFRQGDTYEVQVYGTPVCRITPDNVLTMVLSGSEGRHISNTLSCSLNRLVPVTWSRCGMARYRILGVRTLKPDDSWWTVAKTAPELFKGLQFDLSTGRPINAMPDITDRVDPNKRLDWLRSLRRFKRGIALRAKVGVVDGINGELQAGKIKFNRRMPNWQDEMWMNLLHTSIRDDLYPKELLAGFLLSAPSILWGKRVGMTSSSGMLAVVTSIVNSNSVELRRRFDVFTDEVTSEEAKQD